MEDKKEQKLNNLNTLSNLNSYLFDQIENLNGLENDIIDGKEIKPETLQKRIEIFKLKNETAKSIIENAKIVLDGAKFMDSAKFTSTRSNPALKFLTDSGNTEFNKNMVKNKDEN